MDGKTKQLLTVYEAETLTGRRAATWRKDLLHRKIPYVRIGRQVRIPIEVIEQLVREGYRPSLKQPLNGLTGTEDRGWQPTSGEVLPSD